MAQSAKLPEAVVGRRRPRPQIAQLKRTWYFLSRNTLAMVGLAVILFFVFVAVYSFFLSAPGDQLELYCGTYTGNAPGPSPTSLNLTGACIPVCTYPSNQPPPGPNCYAVDSLNPSQIPPTFNLAKFQAGPLPLGSLTVLSSGNYFFNVYQGEVKGAPWSLGIASGIVVSGAMIGLMLGSIAGFKGGLIDELIMRVTDIFLSIPALLLVLVILAAAGQSFKSLASRVEVLVMAFVITWWPLYTRIVRGQVLVTREQKYVEASRASGAGTGRILVRHIIPNSLYPVFVQMSLDVGAIPLLIGGIAFLGFHIFPTVYFPEWGNLSALGVQVLTSQLTQCSINQAIGAGCAFPWWQIFFPGLVVFLFAISVNFLSDGLRDALDPRLRR